MGKKVIGKCFTCDGQIWFYDTCSQRILAIDAVTAAILPILGEKSDDEIVEEIQGRFPAERASMALKAIRDAQSRHYAFSQDYEIEICCPYREELVRNRCNKALTSLCLNVTERCNFDCPHCPYNENYDFDRNHSSRDMSMETASKAVKFYIDRSSESDVGGIVFYGGEPLLRMDLIREVIGFTREALPDFDRRVAERAFVFGLTTNGSLLTPETAAFCAEHGIKVTVSLDGPACVHDKYRVWRGSLAGTFDSVAQGLRNLRAASDSEYFAGSVSVNCVLHQDEEFPQVAEFFDSDLFKEELGNPAMRTQTEYDYKYRRLAEDPGVPRPNMAECIARYMMDAAEGRDEAGKDQLAANMCRLMLIRFYERGIIGSGTIKGHVFPGGICLPGVRKLFVEVDGRIKICEKVSGMFDECFIGNLDDGIDVKKVARLCREFTELTKEECAECWLLGHCSSMCFMHPKDESGRLSRELKLKRCAEIRDVALGNMCRMIYIFRRNPKYFQTFKLEPSNSKQELRDLGLQELGLNKSSRGKSEPQFDDCPAD